MEENVQCSECCSEPSNDPEEKPDMAGWVEGEFGLRCPECRFARAAPGTSEPLEDIEKKVKRRSHHKKRGALQ